VLFSALDWMTTNVALAEGYHERNPVAKAVYQGSGSLGLLGLKVTVVALIVFALSRMPRRAAVWTGAVFAVITGVAGVAGLPLARWLSETSGTTTTFEYAMGAFFVAYGVVVFGLSALRSVRRAGMAVVIGNLLYSVAAVALVVADVFPLTTTGAVLTLGGGVYTAIFAELQYQGWRRLKA